MSNGVDEIPPDIVAAIEECLGDRVQHGPMFMVRVEGKQLRLDPKIMVLSPHRAFLMAQRTNTKIDGEFNYLEIHTIESTKSLQLQFNTAYPSNKVIKITTVKQEDTRAIIEHILISLKKTFPLTCISKMIPKIFILPPERNTSIHNTVDRMTIPELGPCGGFTQMYACMCDLHGETYQAEVAWDVDTIYLSQDSKELCLNDFDHLESKDLVPIVASLMYNAWFTKLTATNVKLSSDICKEIKKVMTKSTSIEHLVLDNVGIKGDFAKELNTALVANPNTALRHLDLSNNLLEDRGVRHLAGEITKLPNGLVTLRLSKIGMTAESTIQLGKALLENNFMPTSLIKLDLSGNQFKEGDINNLTQFLATPNAITQLDLSDTEIPLDNVFNALYRGCCANLSHLNLSGNVFSYRKNAVVPQAFKQYFATTTGLKVLNLSRNKLPPEVVKEVILGIGSNSNLQDIELDLSSNELRMAGGRVVESCIANVPNITKLNLSNNDLNTSMSSLLAWIGQNQVITSLDISQNLATLRPGAKAMMRVIDAIVDFIQNEETSLTTLSLAGNKLKFETIQIINALGSNTTLTSVDISGNGMGDLGARMLAKALMINTKLRTVALDSNNITAKGFADIAAALERNYTLKYMPTPVNDVSSALKSNAEKTQEALQKIQTLLQRNHSPHKFSDDQAFRLQQGFLYTTSHQLVDQLVVKIQDTSKDLADCDEDCVQTDINRAKDVITDADNSKQLLAILYKVALDSEDSEMINKLEEIVTHVQDAACKRLEDNVSGMLEGATDQCSHLMKDPELRSEIETSCQEKKQLPERFMQDVMEQVSAAIFNRISEANLAVASIISDTIIDEIIEQLTEYQEKLAAYSKQYGKGRSSFCNDTLKTNKPEEITVNGQQEEGEDKKEDGEEEDLPKPKNADGTSVNYTQAKGGRKVRRNPTMRMVQDKRKSVKVRPRSSVVKNEYRSPLMTDDTDMTITEVKEDEEHPQNNSHSPSHPEEPAAASVKPAVSNDTTDGALFSSPAKPIEKPPSPSKKKKEKGLQLDDKAFNELSAASQTRLQDVRKTRPRRPGGMRPTRAGITPQNENNPGDHKEEEKVDAGLDAFYKSDALAPEVTVGKGSLTGSSNSLDTPKDEKSSSIGGRIGGLFKKKPKTPKPEKPKPVKEEKQKTPKEDKPKAPKREKRGLFSRSKKSPSTDETKTEEDSRGREPFQDPNQRALQQALENKKPSIIPDIKDSKQDSTSEEEPLVSSSGDELERDIAVNHKDATKPEESSEGTSKSEEPGDQRKQSYKPPGARGIPGMGMAMPGIGGGNMLAEMKKKQDQRRASNKSQEVEAEKASEESTPEVGEPEKKEEPEKKVEEPEKKVDEPENKVDEPEKKADEPVKKVDEPEKIEDETEKKDEEEKEIKQNAEDEAEKEREENQKEEKKEDKPEENATPTETVKTPEVDSQEKQVPLRLSLRLPSDEDKVASPNKPPSPRISPRPTPSPTKPLPSPTKPTPSPKSSPRTSGIFMADKRASAEIAKIEEEAKEVDKKEDKAEEQSKKEESESSKDEDKTQEDHQESKPQVKLRKPRTPTPTDKRKSIPIPDPEKRKSNPLPVMAKRRSGTPVGADKLIVPSKNTQNKSETESSVKALRNSRNLEERGQDVKSNGEQPKPIPRASPRISTGGGSSPPSKPKPVPKPRPPSGVPPPSVAPKPIGRKSRDGPVGFSSSSSAKLPPNPPGVNKPRSKSLDPNYGTKLPQQINDKTDVNVTPVNGNPKKESISSIEEDEEEDPSTKL